MVIDISQYAKAGYVAQCHCLLPQALEWVKCIYADEMQVRIGADLCTIELEIAPGLWQSSGYYWESDTLFKQEGIR